MCKPSLRVPPSPATDPLLTRRRLLRRPGLDRCTSSTKAADSGKTWRCAAMVRSKKLRSTRNSSWSSSHTINWDWSISTKSADRCIWVPSLVGVGDSASHSMSCRWRCLGEKNMCDESLEGESSTLGMVVLGHSIRLRVRLMCRCKGVPSLTCMMQTLWPVVSTSGLPSQTASAQGDIASTGRQILPVVIYPC